MKVTKIRITAELQGAGIIKVITTYNESNKAFKVESLAKCWEASSEPTAESIGLYLFLDNMRCVVYPMHTCLFCIFQLHASLNDVAFVGQIKIWID